MFTNSVYSSQKTQSIRIWNATPCNPVEVQRHLRNQYCLHSHGRRVREARSHQEADGKRLHKVMSLCNHLRGKLKSNKQICVIQERSRLKRL